MPSLSAPKSARVHMRSPSTGPTVRSTGRQGEFESMRCVDDTMTPSRRLVKLCGWFGANRDDQPGACSLTDQRHYRDGVGSDPRYLRRSPSLWLLAFLHDPAIWTRMGLLSQWLSPSVRPTRDLVTITDAVSTGWPDTSPVRFWEMNTSTAWPASRG